MDPTLTKTYSVEFKEDVKQLCKSWSYKLCESTYYRLSKNNPHYSCLQNPEKFERYCFNYALRYLPHIADTMSAKKRYTTFAACVHYRYKKFKNEFLKNAGGLDNVDSKDRQRLIMKDFTQQVYNRLSAEEKLKLKRDHQREDCEKNLAKSGDIEQLLGEVKALMKILEQEGYISFFGVMKPKDTFSKVLSCPEKKKDILESMGHDYNEMLTNIRYFIYA